MAQPYAAWVVTLGLGFLLASSPAGAEDVRKAVEAGNREFIAAFLRGDASAVANRYTEDAQVIPPGAPVASGRTAIKEFWQTTIAAGFKDLTLETIAVESAGNLAYETGVVRLVSNTGTTTAARYVVVWKRIDEKWLLHRDIWNSLPSTK
jgi:uncharacterized protein (TIGR02246 family)